MIIFQPGDVFAGRYRLEERIGQGGMGTVWRATQLALSREVAIKLILPTATDDARYRRMFMDEAQLSARLVHPNIVPVVDYGEDGELLWLVQQFIRGQDLGRVLQRIGRGLPTPLALHVTIQVLYGLSCAHENFVLHRDIKPGNVLVSHDGNVLLTDFGIAKVFSGSPSISTVIKGSPGYMAPEVLRGEAAVPPTDLFAIGALLWECLTGANLFAHGMQDREQVYLATLHNPVPRLAAVGIAAPPGLDDVLQRLMAKGVADRYPTAPAAIDDLLAVAAPFAREATPKALRQFLTAYADVPARAPTPFPDGAAPLATTDRGKRPKPLAMSTRTSALSGQVLSVPTTARRRTRWWLLAGTLVLAGGAGGVVVAMRDTAPALAAPRPEPPAPTPAPPPAGRLTIKATPADAKIFVDGAPSAANLDKLPLGKEAVVRVERDGYLPSEQKVTIATDTTVAVALTPIPEQKPEEPPPTKTADRRDDTKPATSRHHSPITRGKDGSPPPGQPAPARSPTPVEEEPPPMIPIPSGDTPK
jgi:serine/threonine-protein kinase